MKVERSDVVVVGAGPGGLTAALDLARAGASVTLVDEGDDLGGQYYRLRAPALRAQLGPHRRRGERLVAAVRANGVRVRTNTLVWGADRGTLMTSDSRDGTLGAITARAVVLATGGYERSVPFPGWELPGVVTPGLALRLASVDGVPVGRRVIVGGTGPLLLVAACALLEAGAAHVRVLEHGSGHRPDPDALRILRHPARLAQLAVLRARLARHGVRIEHGTRVVAAEGRGRVERALLSSAGRPESSVEVDALAVGYGLRPATELAQIMGLDCRPDPAAPGDLLPRLDVYGESSLANVFVVGEAAGVGGAPLAEARAQVAAARIRERLGLPAPRAAWWLRHRRRGREAFAAFTARRFPVPQEALAHVPDETLLCRCEGVSAAAVRAAARGAADAGAVKRVTRAGMGLCQGRGCAPAVAAIAAAYGGGTRPLPAPQMPVKPIPVPVSGTAGPDGT